MTQPKPHTPPTLSSNLLEIAARVQSIAYDLCDDCDLETMALLALCDDLEALATDNQEAQFVPTAICLYCGEHFAHETGHACAHLPRRHDATAKEAQHGAA